MILYSSHRYWVLRSPAKKRTVEDSLPYIRGDNVGDKRYCSLCSIIYICHNPERFRYIHLFNGQEIYARI